MIPTKIRSQFREYGKSGFAVFMMVMVALSIFSGVSLAASATGFVANDPTYGSGDSDWEQTLVIENMTASSGEQFTITINDSQDGNINYSSVTAAVDNASWATVNSTSVSGDSYEIVVDVTANQSTQTNLQFNLDGYTFDGAGTATVSVSGAVSGYSDTFSYDSAEGTFSLGQIQNSAGDNISAVDIVISDDSTGTEVVNKSGVEPGNYTTGLAPGNYTVSIDHADYQTVTQTVSITHNQTTSISPTLTRLVIDYEFTFLKDSATYSDVDKVEVYSGSTINDTESPIQTINLSGDNYSVVATNLSSGLDYTVKVYHGNNSTYTESFTASAVDDTDSDGVVQMDVDVSDNYIIGGDSAEQYGSTFLKIVGAIFFVVVVLLGSVALLSGGAGRVFGRRP